MGTDGSPETARSTDLPESLPESDREKWYAMTALQRVRARDRLAAIQAWRKGEIPLADAIKESGLSRTRFYTVAAAFKTSNTLASLGAFAGSGAARERLDPEALNALQAVVADVVATNRGASTSQLMRLLVDAADLRERKIPSATSLRAIVEAEIRRADATGQAGHALKLDLTAINLPRTNGRPHIMFALIDEGTRLVLGVAMGRTADEASGYREAALDAIARINGQLAALRWTDRLQRIDAIVGSDKVKAAALRNRLLEGGVRANVTLSPARYGKYFRRYVSHRLGRIEITPLRTESGLAVPDNGDMTPWMEDAAFCALDQVVNLHNSCIMAKLDLSSGRPVMPDDLERALNILAK